MKEKNGIKNILFHGGILAMAGIFVRIIGLIYRIPMVNIIGDEANGIYGAAFNVYNIMLVLSSYGMPMAVSKLVSARMENKKYKDADSVFKMALLVSMTTGGLAALFMFFGANFIEHTFYSKYSGIAIPLRVLAPTVFIVSLLGVFRGFYQGMGTTIPTAVSQIVEQIVNAIVSIAAGAILIKIYKNSVNRSGYGAAGGTMGTCFGALFALLFLVFIYFIYRPTFSRLKNRDKRRKIEENSFVLKTLILTMIPIIIGQTFYQISAMLDDILYGKLLAGASAKIIKTTMGNYSSSYVLLTSVVMGVASAMSASLLPSIVASKQRNDNEGIVSKISATIKANMFIAMPSFIGMVVLGEHIVALLFPKYNSIQGGNMLKIGGVAVVFYTVATVTSTSLQAIDKLNVPIYHYCISLVIHIILLVILLSNTDLGIYAVVIGNASFPIIVMILNLISLYRYVGYRQEWFETFLVPGLCSVFMGLLVWIVYRFVYHFVSSNFISLIAAFIAAGISYFGTMYVYKKILA